MKTYTYKEAATALNYSYEHIVKLVRDSKLGEKYSTGYLITQKDIDEYQKPKSGRGRGNSKLPDGKTLEKMKEKLTTREIASRYDVTPDAVLKKIRRDKND